MNKPLVLVVDDERLIVELFSTILHASGFEVYGASSSIDALHYISKRNYDLLVCDVQIDHIDGFDIVTALREKDETVPALLVTGFPKEEDRRRAGRMGVSYLPKQQALETLAETIPSILSPVVTC